MLERSSAKSKEMTYGQAMSFLQHLYNSGIGVSEWYSFRAGESQINSGICFVNTASNRDTVIISRNKIMEFYLTWIKSEANELLFSITVRT